MTLQESRKAWEALREAWESTIARKFPGCGSAHWFRACDRLSENPIARHNEDTSKDAALVADVEIRESYDAYIKALHAFYLLRDGPGGVLGGRGL